MYKNKEISDTVNLGIDGYNKAIHLQQTKVYKYIGNIVVVIIYMDWAYIGNQLK